jgi:hypothetical protein
MATENITAPFEHNVYLGQSSIPLMIDLAGRTGEFFFNERAVAFQGKDITVIINQVTAPKYNFYNTAMNYVDGEVSIPLEKDSIKLFTRRAAELSERLGRAIVSITVQEGGLHFALNEGIVENEEFFVAEGLKPEAEMKVLVGADNITQALAHSDKIIVDFIDRYVLVFTNSDETSPFTYIVSGKRS